MKNIIKFFLVLLLLSSCNTFKEKKDFTFIYEFENEEKISFEEISTTIRVLEKRLDALGVEYNIQKFYDKKIKLDIKAIDLNTKRLNYIILNQGKLEFWELYRGENFFSIVADINNFYADKSKTDSIQPQPLFDKIASSGYQGGPVIFQSKPEDTAAVNLMLNNKEVRFLLTSDYLNTKFLWGVADENNHHPLYAAKSNRKNIPPITGESIVEAKQYYDVLGKPIVTINMDKKGAITWERITGNAYRNMTYIGVTLNDLVYTAPGVSAGPIKGGKSEVSGDFTLEQAQDLAIILSSQKSIAKLKLLKK